MFLRNVGSYKDYIREDGNIHNYRHQNLKYGRMVQQTCDICLTDYRYHRHIPEYNEMLTKE
jgi:hypothetical protein